MGQPAKSRPLFILAVCIDKPDVEVAQKRKDFLSVHLEYIEKTIDKIMVAGPLYSDDGKTISGSLYLYKTADKKEAKSWHEADPYFKADIWQEVRYNVFYGAAGDAVGGLAY